MINETGAKKIAEQHVDLMEIDIKMPIKITRIQEFDFGWIFFYQSEKYLETGDYGYLLAGNAPFVVDKNTGELTEFGTAHPVDYYIEEYRAHRKII